MNTQPVFVAAVTTDLRSCQQLIPHSRLYAYPAKPEPPPNPGFIILDSGAFGLSQSGQKIGAGWMRKLGRHYRDHRAGADFPILAIAPDAYLDAQTTISNYRWWQKHITLPVVPVIQFQSVKKLDLYHVIEQANYYAQFQPPVVAISNPGMRAIEAGSVMSTICVYVKQITGCRWLHNLGAGWSPVDAMRWFGLGFDSIDTIAYYTDAQSGLAWRSGSDEKSTRPDVDWRDLAIANLHAVQRML